MASKTIIITGASDGVGAAAANRLSAAGHNVVVIGRSPEKTAAVAAPLGADYFVADFADLAQVRDLADNLLQRYPRIDVLANNAGGTMAKQRGVTIDGHEKTFQVNHLAPFLLTTLLLDRLVDSSATVINTSSMASRFGAIDLDDLDATARYRPSVAYARSKLMNILFTKELHHRYHDVGISTVAFHPGPVASNFGAETGMFLYRVVYQSPLKNLVLIGPDKGADQLVWMATSSDWTSGEYYAKHRIARTNKQVDSPAIAATLWERSREMVAVATSPTEPEVS